MNADVRQAVEILYKYLSDTKGLEKAREEQQRLKKATEETATANDKARQASERAAIQNRAQAAAARKAAEDLEEAAKRAARADREAAIALQNRERAINGVKIAGNNARQALEKMNPAAAQSIGHIAGLADGAADAVQSYGQFTRATNNLEKALGAVGIVGSAGAAILEATNLVIKQIEKSTENYVKGAQRRHFDGAKASATQHRQLNEAIASGSYEYDRGKTFGENYNAMLRDQASAASEAALAQDRLNSSHAEATAAGERLKAEGLDPVSDAIEEGIRLSELMTDAQERWGESKAIEMMAGKVGAFTEKLRQMDPGMLKEVEGALSAVAMGVGSGIENVLKEIGRWDVGTKKVAETTLKTTSVIRDAWGNLKEVQLVDGLTADMKELAEGTSLVRDAWGNLKAINLVSTLEDNAEAIEEEGDAAETATEQKSALAEAEYEIADGASAASEAASESSSVFDWSTRNSGGLPDIDEQSWSGEMDGDSTGEPFLSLPATAGLPPLPDLGGLPFMGSGDVMPIESGRGSLRGRGGDYVGAYGAAGKSFSLGPRDVSARGGGFQLAKGIDPNYRNSGPNLGSVGGGGGGGRSSWENTGESGVDMGSGSGWDPSAAGGDLGAVEAQQTGIPGAGDPVYSPYGGLRGGAAVERQSQGGDHISTSDLAAAIAKQDANQRRWLEAVTGS